MQVKPSRNLERCASIKRSDVAIRQLLHKMGDARLTVKCRLVPNSNEPKGIQVTSSASEPVSQVSHVEAKKTLRSATAPFFSEGTFASNGVPERLSVLELDSVVEDYSIIKESFESQRVQLSPEDKVVLKPNPCAVRGSETGTEGTTCLLVNCH